jgi:hypothetical protein
MKQQQVEPPKAFDPLAALELAAPPGTEYSDAIVAYQIGVFFRANPETLQKRLPGGWKVADQWGPGPRGKLLEGANVVMGFHETFLESEKAPSKNKPHGRFVTFAAMAHNPSTDERCNISFTGFNADPAKVPGKYKDKKLARSISRKLSVTGDDASTLVSESFDVDTGDGSIHFAVDYSRQQPLWLYATAVPPDAVVFRAAADPKRATHLLGRHAQLYHSESPRFDRCHEQTRVQDRRAGVARCGGRLRDSGGDSSSLFVP